LYTIIRKTQKKNEERTRKLEEKKQIEKRQLANQMRLRDIEAMNKSSKEDMAITQSQMDAIIKTLTGV